MENLDFNLHTVILLVGPTNSGKTHFSQKYLIPKLRAALEASSIPVTNVQYISSDSIRRDLLGDESVSKYARRMLQVSNKAFRTLHQRIDAAMEYPHNAQFVVVDTTGLNESFRKEVLQQAKKANYNVAVVIFDYKSADEYLKYVPTDLQDRRLLYNHIERLRKDVWRTIKKSDYDQIFRITSKDFDKYQISPRFVDTYAKCFLSPELNYDVVGDTHGCLDELKELIQKLGHTIDTTDPAFPHGKVVLAPGRGLVLVGDIIDKGPKSKETLEFVYLNARNNTLSVVWGNHENFVLQYLSGKITESGMAEDVRKTYFDTTETFDEQDRLRLWELSEIAAPFLIHPEFIVTHAPCENKFLGKLDRLSIKMQRGQYQVPRRKESPDVPSYIGALEERFSFLRDEATLNAPIHVFGHVSLASGLRLKNKVGVDTGCAAGGRLTAAQLGRKVYFCHVASKQEKTEELVNLFRRTDAPEVDLSQLENREYKRLIWSARNKVSFISGTIAPADADKENNVLESFQKAMDYYRDHGVQTVVVQPKYMGSRCNIYLSENIEECYAVSRNGFKISRLDLTDVFKKLQVQLRTVFERGVKQIVLDGELMPWSALGSGLIEEQYRIVERGLKTEFEALADAGFDDLMSSARSEAAEALKQFEGQPSKEALAEKVGQAKGHTIRCLMDIPDLPVPEHQKLLAVYSRQIDVFGGSGEISFKPFSVLRATTSDGEESFQETGCSNQDTFLFISKDEQKVVHTDNPFSRQEGEQFFLDLTSRLEMEGVVVKPQFITDGVAPALKVRGENYLTLVYGYDYKLPGKYSRLVRNKSVGKKIRTSIEEFKIGQKMLRMPVETIDEGNEAYLQLVAQMILEEKQEKTLDPRL